MRVLFWGTPDFGIPSLDALAGGGHDVVAVVTNPDRPAGRGRKLTASPIKRWALERSVPVLQPERPRGEAFMQDLAGFDPDVAVVAAYGRILREEVLELPRLGSLNVHASVLPALRGAAPVNRAIMRGHEESGVTIMRMVLALDAGPMLRVVRTPIGPDTTAGELYDELARLGADALVETLAEIERGSAVETPQDDSLATYAPKLDRAAARMDWDRPATELSWHVRGCDPWPAAWTTLDGDAVQCFAPRVEDTAARTDARPGEIVSAEPATGLRVATRGGDLVLRELRPAGKRRMDAADWLRGQRDLEGRRFE